MEAPIGLEIDGLQCSPLFLDVVETCPMDCLRLTKDSEGTGASKSINACDPGNVFGRAAS